MKYPDNLFDHSIFNESAEIFGENIPFRYSHIKNVFTEEFYEKLHSKFIELLSGGISDTFDMNKFSYFGQITKETKYDAYSRVTDPNCNITSIFYSNLWKNFISNLFPDIELTVNSASSFHHHKVNSTSGFLHTDWNLQNFVKDELPNGINPWYFQCKHAGEPGVDNAYQVVKSIACIYYLGNEEWNEGYGGDTGLYTHHNENNFVKAIPYENQIPYVKIPPVNNSMVVYEISPYSYHGFIQNKKIERNAMIQWFYSNVSNRKDKYKNWKLNYNG
jgi:hypothetical protein